MSKLLNDFNNIYNGLYELDDNISLEFSDISSIFDRLLKNNADFKKAVEELNAERMDLILSDREAVAFFLAYISNLEY